MDINGDEVLPKSFETGVWENIESLERGVVIVLHEL